MSLNDATANDDTKSTLNNKPNEIYTHVQTIMDNMKKDFDSFRVTCMKEIDSLKEDLNQKDMEISSLKKDLSMKEQRIDVLEGRLQDGDYGRMVDELTKLIKDNKEEIESRLHDIDNGVEAVSYLVMKWKHKMIVIKEMERKLIYYINYRSLCSDLKEEDFVWKYHNLSKYQREDRFSDDFYINGYRLRLCLNLTGSKIALWCYVMQGINDNNLQWPLRDRVTLSILNQKTFRPFKPKSYQYDSYISKYRWVFERPQWERNNKSRIGTYGFVEYSEIVDIDSIIIKDSIVVSCSVDRL